MIQTILHKHLRQLLAAIANGDGPAISESLGELDKLLAERPGEIDARLRHFLQRRSYEKALAWIEADEAPAGDLEGSQ